MEDLIKELKKKFRLLLFSGNIKERIKFLYEKYSFLHCFDDAVFSFDYKKNKEDIEFYKELLKHIQCEPSQAIMIDDELKNIKLAKSVGLQTIYYCYPDQLLDELKNFGIKISI
jgi:2-haloacid dehalogenase